MARVLIARLTCSRAVRGVNWRPNPAGRPESTISRPRREWGNRRRRPRWRAASRTGSARAATTAIDHAHRVRQIGVEQHDRQPARLGLRQQVGFAHLAADEAGDLTHRLVALDLAAVGSRGVGSMSSSVRKFCERTARFSSLLSTKSNASGVSTRSPRRGRDRRPSRRSVELRFLDLVEQRLVADAQDFRRFAAVPAGLLQRAVDQLALGFARGVAGDVLERSDQAGCRSAAARRRRRGLPTGGAGIAGGAAARLALTRSAGIGLSTARRPAMRFGELAPDLIRRSRG